MEWNIHRKLRSDPATRMSLSARRGGGFGVSPPGVEPQDPAHIVQACHIIKAIIFPSFPGELSCPPRQLQPVAFCGMCQGKGSAAGIYIPDDHNRILSAVCLFARSWF